MQIAKTTIIFLAALLASCERAEFETIEETGATEPSPDETPVADGDATPNPDDDVELDEVAKACAELTKQDYHQTVLFADPDQPCPWECDDNMGPVDRKVRARIEQHLALDVPEGALICEIDIQFFDQQMRFDDEVFLLYNGVIMAASINYENVLPQKDGLVFYNWEALRNQNYDPQAQDPYCLGEKEGKGSCDMPYTETVGNMSLAFEGSLYQKIAAHTPTQTPTFSFVTIGDNNTTDCRHNDFQFFVTARFVQP